MKLSKSASVVSVALQLPDSESQGTPNGRLTDKFPSDNSLWLILRKFESGVAGGLGIRKNFTARGVPITTNGDAGAGRLYYETPVIQYLGKEISGTPELQKSLGKLGFNGGSILLRLGFRATQEPLEEAMQNIDAYFKSIEQGDSDSKGAHAGSVATSYSVPDAYQPASTDADAESKSPAEPMLPLSEPTSDPIEPSNEGISSTIPSLNEEHNKDDASEIPISPPPTESLVTGPNQRPISVYAPSTSSTPRAAQQAFDEKDYELDISQAKRYQRHLQDRGQNQRLASYAEEEVKRKVKAQNVAATKMLTTRIRFPDQTIVDAQFTNLDTAATLYDCVRGLLRNENAPFLLNYTSAKGPKEIPKYAISMETNDVRKENTQRLILDLGLVGRTVVNFIWEAEASLEARRHPVLKPEYANSAKEIQVQAIQGQDDEETVPAPSSSKPQSNAKTSGADRKGMPAWMKKTLGKK